MNKHIIFILPSLRGGGTERVVSQLANAYVNMNIEVSFLLFAGNQIAYDLDKRIKIVCVGKESKGNILNTIKKICRIRKYYRANRNSYVFAFAPMGAAYTRLTTVGCNIKMLVSERNDPRMFEHKAIRNWGYGKATVIVAQTEEMLEYLPARFRPLEIVIPNAVPPELPERYEGVRTKRIVNVGRLEPQKNQKMLLEAFSIFSEKHSEYILEIYGDGYLRKELEDYSKQLSINEKVFFKGFCKNVREQIVDAAMFVMTSDYEGISNAMIEAVAMGVPSICTDCPVGGAKMYIENGVSGILVPVGDATKVAESMAKMADNSNIADIYSRNAIGICDKYCIDEIALKFLRAIIPNCNF